MGRSLRPIVDQPCFLAQVLALLLLSVPQALGAAAELEVPLSPVCSLLFYLAFLLLWAVHVVVCTSAESSRYLCSLAWPVAGGVLALVSALLCGVLSTLTRTCVNGKLLRRVRLALRWDVSPCVSRPLYLSTSPSRRVRQAQRGRAGEDSLSSGSGPTSHSQLRADRSQTLPVRWEDRVPVTEGGRGREMEEILSVMRENH